MPRSAEPETLLPLQPATFHVLLALARQDLHGYAVMQDVEARTNGRIRLSAGTLYRTIHRLLEQGLVVEARERPAPEEDDERRRYYRLTLLGRQVARAETARLAGLVDMARERGIAPEEA
ncbi:MAG TPA: PadR family transcriptional regulator [Thermoanaerobaculia bacterium]|nr:PadR family transcriptional regulator [Thermoanaerobaculia bacterium]